MWLKTKQHFQYKQYMHSLFNKKKYKTLNKSCLNIFNAEIFHNLEENLNLNKINKKIILNFIFFKLNNCFF